MCLIKDKTLERNILWSYCLALKCRENNFSMFSDVPDLWSSFTPFYILARVEFHVKNQAFYILARIEFHVKNQALSASLCPYNTRVLLLQFLVCC